METANIVQRYTNDKMYTVTVKDSTGTVVNLTNCTVLVTIKSKKEINVVDGTDSNALLTKTITSFVNPTSGVFTFSITSDDTKTLGVGKFYFDIKVVTLAGLEYSVSPGEVEIQRSVTQRS